MPTPAPILDYAGSPNTVSFPRRLLILPVLVILTTSTFYLLQRYTPYVYLGPPPLLGTAETLSSLAIWIGLPLSLASLVWIFITSNRPGRRFPAHIFLKTLFSFFCLLTGLPFHLQAESELRFEYRGAPFRRTMYEARSIVQTCCIYAADHDGHYPPHLAALLLTDNPLRPKDIAGFDFIPTVLPAPLPPESAWLTIAADVDAHSAFIYTAADLIDSITDSNIIAVYSHPTRVAPAHRIVAFADAHAELVRVADLPALFAASNTARAKHALPPFALDGPPPAAK